MKTLKQLCKELDKTVAQIESQPKQCRKTLRATVEKIRKAMRKLEGDDDVESYMSQEFQAV